MTCSEPPEGACEGSRRRLLSRNFPRFTGFTATGIYSVSCNDVKANAIYIKGLPWMSKYGTGAVKYCPKAIKYTLKAFSE